MRLRNRDGSAVDPVPFAVTAGLGSMLTMSLGPLYGQALGASLPTAVAASSAVLLAVVAVAYHRYVWTVRPELRGHVPGAVRIERLFFLMIALAVLLVGLSIPLVAGT